MQPVNESKKQTKRWYKKWWGLLLLIVFVGPFALLIFLGTLAAIFTSVSSKDSSQSKASEDKPQQAEQAQAQETPKTQTSNYEIKIAGNDYADPTARKVTFTVTNTGQVEGNPACNIDVFNDAKTYTGYEYATWKTPLKPGEFKYYSELIIVTNEGATYATNVKVKCS